MKWYRIERLSGDEINHPSVQGSKGSYRVELETVEDLLLLSRQLNCSILVDTDYARCLTVIDDYLD